jgi:hypothetical protein
MQATTERPMRALAEPATELYGPEWTFDIVLCRPCVGELALSLLGDVQAARGVAAN